MSEERKIKTYFTTRISSPPIEDIIFTRISVKLHWKKFSLNAEAS